jgi:hypothetical protein
VLSLWRLARRQGAHYNYRCIGSTTIDGVMRLDVLQLPSECRFTLAKRGIYICGIWGYALLGSLQQYTLVNSFLSMARKVDSLQSQEQQWQSDPVVHTNQGLQKILQLVLNGCRAI